MQLISIEKIRYLQINNCALQLHIERGQNKDLHWKCASPQHTKKGQTHQFTLKVGFNSTHQKGGKPINLHWKCASPQHTKKGANPSIHTESVLHLNTPKRGQTHKFTLKVGFNSTHQIVAPAISVYGLWHKCIKWHTPNVNIWAFPAIHKLVKLNILLSIDRILWAHPMYYFTVKLLF